MRGRLAITTVSLAVAAACHKTPTTPTATATSEPLVIVNGAGAVSAGYTVFVNTDQGKTNWLSQAPDGLTATYEGNQAWGFVAIALAGATTPGSRPGKDVSAYKTLRVQLRGASGGESIALAVKDALDPDDGSETRKLMVLSSSWTTIDTPLTEYRSADMKALYVLFLIVFDGAAPRTIFFRDVQFLP